METATQAAEQGQRGQCRHGDRRAAPALRRPAADGRGDPAPACQHHHLDPQPAAGRGDLGREPGGGERGRARGPHPSRADHPVRRRNLAGGPHQRPARGPVGRLLAHEPGARRQRARSRLRGGARRLAQAAQRLPARFRPVLPGRPRRRRGHHRRHGRHPRLRHQRGALRHHARERAQPHRRDGRRLHRQDGAARAQILRRLRPDAAPGRLGRARSASSPRSPCGSTAYPRRSSPPCVRSRRWRAPATP